MGVADLVYPLNFVESFAFGSLISAVDPVATLAIFQVNIEILLYRFHNFEPIPNQQFFIWMNLNVLNIQFQALDVDPVLNMLVFGESILNDAVAIGMYLQN
jgi:sodium/hydrogen exchanger 8